VAVCLSCCCCCDSCEIAEEGMVLSGGWRTEKKFSTGLGGCSLNEWIGKGKGNE